MLDAPFYELVEARQTSYYDHSIDRYALPSFIASLVYRSCDSVREPSHESLHFVVSNAREDRRDGRLDDDAPVPVSYNHREGVVITMDAVHVCMFCLDHSVNSFSSACFDVRPSSFCQRIGQGMTPEAAKMPLHLPHLPHISRTMYPFLENLSFRKHIRSRQCHFFIPRLPPFRLPSAPCPSRRTFRFPL